MLFFPPHLRSGCSFIYREFMNSAATAVTNTFFMRKKQLIHSVQIKMHSYRLQQHPAVLIILFHLSEIHHHSSLEVRQTKFHHPLHVSFLLLMLHFKLSGLTSLPLLGHRQPLQNDPRGLVPNVTFILHPVHPLNHPTCSLLPFHQ